MNCKKMVVAEKRDVSRMVLTMINIDGGRWLNMVDIAPFRG